MASNISYVLVSDPDDVTAVKNHDIVEEYDLNLHDMETEEGAVATITFRLERPLEDAPDLATAARTLSSDFSTATVLLCDIEERFDHIERTHSRIFREGTNAGQVEHGFVFNIGGS